MAILYIYIYIYFIMCKVKDETLSSILAPFEYGWSKRPWREVMLKSSICPVRPDCDGMVKRGMNAWKAKKFCNTITMCKLAFGAAVYHT
jgi:hypothetical protein